MENQEVSQEFVLNEGEADMDVANEKGSLTSQKNDSIGLASQMLRGSEEEELTPS